MPIPLLVTDNLLFLCKLKTGKNSKKEQKSIWGLFAYVADTLPTELPRPVPMRAENILILFQWVQRRMISVDNFFLIFEIIIFCFDVAIFGLVRAVRAMYGLP